MGAMRWAHLNKLKKDLENSEVPNPEKFLVEAKDMVMCCRDMLIKLEENIGAALAKLQNERPTVTEKDLSEPVPSDPGLRPTPLSDSQRLYLAQLGPQQPILFNYPCKKDITTGHKQNSFCSTWYSQYPFLEYSIEKDAAFCFVCQMFPQGACRHPSEKNWSSIGIRKWQKNEKQRKR